MCHHIVPQNFIILNFSKILIAIFQRNFQNFQKFYSIFLESISWNFPKYFSKLSKQFTLTHNNVSQPTSQLLVWITQPEIECDHKEEWETEFGDYNADYGFFLWYISHIFHYNWMQNHRMRPRFVSKYCSQYSTYFCWRPKIDIFWPNHFRSQFLKIVFFNFVYGFLDHITYTNYSWKTTQLTKARYSAFYVPHSTKAWLRIPVIKKIFFSELLNDTKT